MRTKSRLIPISGLRVRSKRQRVTKNLKFTQAKRLSEHFDNASGMSQQISYNYDVSLLSPHKPITPILINESHVNERDKLVECDEEINMRWPLEQDHYKPHVIQDVIEVQLEDVEQRSIDLASTPELLYMEEEKDSEDVGK